MIKLAIDASNISTGGGLTHLVKLLSAADPLKCNIESIHVWANKKVVQEIPKKEWLILHSPSWCNKSLFLRVLIQQFFLPLLINKYKCNVLLSPGGTLPIWSSVPLITISQNMLPFEPDRAFLFGKWSVMRFKMMLLRIVQGRSFKKADGVIFLTKYARDAIVKKLRLIQKTTAIIPHGIEPRFLMKPRTQRANESFFENPFDLLYVSAQLPYKHHIELIQAVYKLRQKGYQLRLFIVGSNSGSYGDQVSHLRLRLDPDQTFLHDLTHINFENLHLIYQKVDAFVFASSCENLPNILLEAMAAGLPIVSSKLGPMPEVLGGAGIYFHPESIDSISNGIESLVTDRHLRSKIAELGWKKAKLFSWERCAKETLDFVSNISSQFR